MRQLASRNGIKLCLFLLIVLAVDLDDHRSVSGFPATSTLVSQIDAAANSLQTCVQFPGMTLAVVKLGKTDGETVLFTRNYGLMDIESKRPVDDDTRFCVGSVTKGFTAALLVQMLRENGSYTLDTPVQHILGQDFKLSTPELTEKSTIRDILAHRVGVAKHFGAFLMGYNMSRPEIVRRVRHLPVSKPFRASRVYNNFMYVVAGQLAEKLNGSWWESQIATRFLKSLNMDKTTFADRVADWGTAFALPHALDDGRLTPLRAKVTGNILRPLGPAGSICTTSGNMAEWLLMHLRNGTNRSGKTVLDPGVIEDLFQVHNAFRKPMGFGKDSFDVESLALGYGLGWVVGKYRGTRRVFHSGFANYYYSMVSVLPDENIAIFTALNGPHLVKCDNGMKALHFYIADLLLEEKPWINASTICSYPRQWLQKAAKPPADTKPSSGPTTAPWSTAGDEEDPPTSVASTVTDFGSTTDPHSTDFGSTTDPYSTETTSTGAWPSGWTSDAASTTFQTDFLTDSSFVNSSEPGRPENESETASEATLASAAPETRPTENPLRRRTLKSKKRFGSTTESRDVAGSETTTGAWPSGWISDVASTTFQTEPSFGTLLQSPSEPENQGETASEATLASAEPETKPTENPLRRRTLKSKKRSKSTTSTVTSSSTGGLDCSSDACGVLSAASESQTEIETTTTTTTTRFETSQVLPEVAGGPESAGNTTFGSRLRPGKRPLRRRRPKRNAGIMAYFKKYEGRYGNPFFGDLVISINRTVLALQLNYGYYGKALLQPNSKDKNNVFRMRFFNSIWYQSESDDMKLFAKLGMFDVQFGSSRSDGSFDKIVVFLFDTENPPVFTR